MNRHRTIKINSRIVLRKIFKVSVFTFLLFRVLAFGRLGSKRDTEEPNIMPIFVLLYSLSCSLGKGQPFSDKNTYHFFLFPHGSVVFPALFSGGQLTAQSLCLMFISKIVKYWNRTINQWFYFQTNQMRIQRMEYN